MAAHPRSELIVHILDPSRSVEGNFLQYTVSTTDGRVLNGLLAGETKTSIDLLDAEGKKQTILREDIEELAASKKSVMPEGFEKSVPPEGLADLLAVPHAEGEVPAARPPQGRHAHHDRGGAFRARRAGRAAGLRGLGPEGRRRRAVRAGRPAGRPPAERDHAERPEREARAEDAEVGHPAGERPGPGDPPAERRGRSWDSRSAARGPSR